MWLKKNSNNNLKSTFLKTNIHRKNGGLMKKPAMLIVAMATLTMLVANVSIASIPAPPVNQNLGFDDKDFNDITASECLRCHGNNTSDRHHFLYSNDMPDGVCSATTDPTPRDCYLDEDCVTASPICSNSGDPCVVDADCPRQYQHPICTTLPYCAGTSAAAKIDGSLYNGGIYDCLTCHEERTVDSVTVFLVERDCMVCHEQLPNSPSVHHLDEEMVGAKAGNCKICHGNIVDDMDDGHLISGYAPDDITPEPVTTELSCSDAGWGETLPCSTDADCTPPEYGTCESGTCGNPSLCSNGGATCTTDDDCTVKGATCDPQKAGVATQGACNFCHDAGTDAATGMLVEDNHDTHHGTGVYKDRYGNTYDEAICSWCHYQGSPSNDGGYDPLSIRTCEGCHGMESLHSIQADSNSDNAITVGAELYGYGHVGIDDPTGDSDCTGCHGNVYGTSMTLPGPGFIVPSIDVKNVINTIVANSDAQITIPGNAFTNDAFTSVIELTPVIGGDTLVIIPSAISVDSITATLNVPVGLYTLRAAKSGVESNMVMLLSAGAEVIISNVECEDTTVTIEGSNFGAEIPAGIQSFMNVIQDGIKLTIVSWTDTIIVATGGNCNGGPVTVNGLFGSATR
jgi:hypothetical protein